MNIRSTILRNAFSSNWQTFLMMTPNTVSLIIKGPCLFSWAQFCCKMWGGQLSVKRICSFGRCRSEVL